MYLMELIKGLLGHIVCYGTYVQHLRTSAWAATNNPNGGTNLRVTYTGLVRVLSSIFNAAYIDW